MGELEIGLLLKEREIGTDESRDGFYEQEKETINRWNDGTRRSPTHCLGGALAHCH